MSVEKFLICLSDLHKHLMVNESTMLYADDLCSVSLSSAGLQQLLSNCDKYCAVLFFTDYKYVFSG